MHHMLSTLKMCLAEPVRVLKVEGYTAKVDVEGTVKTVDASLIRGLRKGDHILLHGNLAIQKLTKKDTTETLKIIAEIET
jgi:hydrogenase assembly chaperone HypC/HupF